MNYFLLNFLEGLCCLLFDACCVSSDEKKTPTPPRNNKTHTKKQTEEKKPTSFTRSRKCVHRPLRQLLLLDWLTFHHLSQSLHHQQQHHHHSFRLKASDTRAASVLAPAVVPALQLPLHRRRLQAPRFLSLEAAAAAVVTGGIAARQLLEEKEWARLSPPFQAPLSPHCHSGAGHQRSGNGTMKVSALQGERTLSSLVMIII